MIHPKKPPVIRPNNRKPFRKCTEAERDERANWLADVLTRAPALSRFQIHKIMCPKYDLDWSTVDRIYIPYARRLLKERANLSAPQAKNLGVNLLMEIIRSGSPRERLLAEHRLSEIYGYNAPRHTVLSGKLEMEQEGRPLKDVAPERLRELAAFDN